MPNYVFLLYGPTDDVAWEPGTPAWDAQVAEHAAFEKVVSDAGAAIVGGAALDRPESARTVRGTAADSSVVDGPFAETREMLGGFYVIEAADLDAAVALARLCPEQVIEVRPAIDTD